MLLSFIGTFWSTSWLHVAAVCDESPHMCLGGWLPLLAYVKWWAAQSPTPDGAKPYLAVLWFLFGSRTGVIICSGQPREGAKPLGPSIPVLYFASWLSVR